MARGIIYYNHTKGRLVRDLVWTFDLVTGELLTMVKGIVYGEVAQIKRNIKQAKTCSVSKLHDTSFKPAAIRIDLFGKNTLGDFVPLDDGLPVISEPFALRLRTSKLTGWRVQPIVSIGVNQSWFPKRSDIRGDLANPKLFYLEFTGNGGQSHARFDIANAPNECPSCHKEPMVCRVCGHRNWPSCVRCGKWSLFDPKDPEWSNPKGFVLKGYPPQEQIVEAKQWDGRDFFRADGIPMVSKNAKEWLEKTHTFPIAFKPAVLNIEGVEHKFT